MTRARTLGHSLALALAIAAPLSASGCGSTSSELVARPITAAQAAVYDNGIDYVDNPALLEGSWLETWEQEIDQRVSQADAVSYVTISTIRTDADLERRETFRLTAHSDSIRYGQIDEDMVIVSARSDAGFDTVRGNDTRILNNRFVLFLRWVQEDVNSPRVARWHMSPASDLIVRRVNSLVDARHGDNTDRRRIIIRETQN
jgi:hypothetical protein